MSKIPDPLVLYYKPPNSNEYVKLNEALDELYSMINKNKDS